MTSVAFSFQSPDSHRNRNLFHVEAGIRKLFSVAVVEALPVVGHSNIRRPGVSA